MGVSLRSILYLDLPLHPIPPRPALVVVMGNHSSPSPATYARRRNGNSLIAAEAIPTAPAPAPLPQVAAVSMALPLTATVAAAPVVTAPVSVPFHPGIISNGLNLHHGPRLTPVGLAPHQLLAQVSDSSILRHKMLCRASIRRGETRSHAHPK